VTIKTVAEARKHAEAQLEQLRLNVFERPPSDWDGFQRLLGSYQAYSQQVADLTPLKNDEDEK
jgi:hypothetical protein